MTADHAIALAASFGACLSALATFTTVLQISRQRKEAYRPKLTMPRLPLRFSIGTDRKPSHERETVSLVNLGFGAAINIRVKWHFDVVGTIQKLNELASKTQTQCHLSLEKNLLKVHSKEFGEVTFTWFPNREEELDFALPVVAGSVERLAVALPAPYVYMLQLGVILYFRDADQQKTSHLQLPEFSPLIATIRYDDLSLSETADTFSFKPELMSARFGDNVELEMTLTPKHG